MHGVWETAELRWLLLIWKLDTITRDHLMLIMLLSYYRLPASNFVFCQWYSIVILLQSFLEMWKCTSYPGEHRWQGKGHNGIWMSSKGRWEGLLEEIIHLWVSFWRWKSWTKQRDFPDFARSWHIFTVWLLWILSCLRHFHHLQTDCFKSNPWTAALLITGSHRESNWVYLIPLTVPSPFLPPQNASPLIFLQSQSPCPADPFRWQHSSQERKHHNPEATIFHPSRWCHGLSLGYTGPPKIKVLEEQDTPTRR